jgi:hypothetical protein
LEDQKGSRKMAIGQEDKEFKETEEKDSTDKPKKSSAEIKH